MKIPESITLHEAREIVRNFNYKIETETVPVLDAVGRVLAKDVYSDIDVTPFDDSAMDGFAVVSSDLENASETSPVELCCVGHVGAGSVYDKTLQQGEAVRIMTGAPMPKGADAVVKIEDVSYSGEGTIGDAIKFTSAIKLGKNIRAAGQEARAGECILSSKTHEQITPASVGKLAACGNLEVEVYKRPLVGIISIGSELIDASQDPKLGEIRNSNVWAMQAYVKDAGGLSRVYPALPDDYEKIKQTFAKAAAECDLVVSTGGACLGDFDLTPKVLRELGSMLFERVNIKPGKSQPFGEINSTPVFVLSGNPGASSVGFELYVRLAMRIMQGFKNTDRPVVRARVLEDVKKSDPRMFLQRGRVSADVSADVNINASEDASVDAASTNLEESAPTDTSEKQASLDEFGTSSEKRAGSRVQNEETKFKVQMAKNQSSALFDSLSKANCLAIVPEGYDGVCAGDYVDCIILASEDTSFI